jgi:hypothetical protein
VIPKDVFPLILGNDMYKVHFVRWSSNAQGLQMAKAMYNTSLHKQMEMDNEDVIVDG